MSIVLLAPAAYLAGFIRKNMAETPILPAFWG
jgi:hypothetical protein